MRITALCTIAWLGLLSITCADVVMVTRNDQESSAFKKSTLSTKKIKGKKVRREDTSGSDDVTVTIENHATMEEVILRPRTKTYEVKRKSTLKEQSEQGAIFAKKAGILTEERPVLHSTGKSELVNGYKTDIYTCSIPVRQTTFWLAPELVRYVPILAAAHNPYSASIERQLPDEASFPGVIVKCVAVQQMGPMKVTITTTLISIKETELDDSEFAIPADYKPKR